MSIYLRFKRQKTTIFLLCEKGEPLSELKARISDLTDQHRLDVAFFEYLTPEKEAARAEAKRNELKTQAQEKKKSKKKHVEEEPEPTGPVPLDEALTVEEHGLDNDDIVLFAFRMGDSAEWEPLQAEGVVELVVEEEEVPEPEPEPVQPADEQEDGEQAAEEVAEPEQ